MCLLAHINIKWKKEAAMEGGREGERESTIMATTRQHVMLLVFGTRYPTEFGSRKLPPAGTIVMN